MTRPVLVLVTGSRALAGNADAEAWLRGRLDALAPSVVVAGDASGPDSIAAAWSTGRGVPLRRYDGCGRITDGVTLCGRWAPAAAVPATDANHAQWAAWYLHRDRVMVRHVAAKANNYSVTVLALRCPQSKTNGTAFTVGRAKAAGLTVEERVLDRTSASNPPLPRVGL